MSNTPAVRLSETEKLCFACKLPDCNSKSPLCAVYAARRQQARADSAYRKARAAILSDAPRAAQ